MGKLITKPCKHCGKTFEAEIGKRQQFCTDACRKQAHDDKTQLRLKAYATPGNPLYGIRRYTPKPNPRPCSVCGQQHTNKSSRYCSDKCRRLISGRSKMTSTVKDRMIVALFYKLHPDFDDTQLKIETFSRVEILERDGWSCHICGNPIDRDAKLNSTGYGTVDHLIPLIEGGEHTRANVKAAHQGCNSRKHNRRAFLIGSC